MQLEEHPSSILVSWILVAVMTNSERFVSLAPKVLQYQMRLVILIVLISIFLKAPCVSYFDKADPGINPSEILLHTTAVGSSSYKITTKGYVCKVSWRNRSSISSHAANIWHLRAAGKTLCSSFLDGKYSSSANCILQNSSKPLTSFQGAACHREMLVKGVGRQAPKQHKS